MELDNLIPESDYNYPAGLSHSGFINNRYSFSVTQGAPGII